MPRGKPTPPSLEYLATPWKARAVTELGICGHPYMDAAPASAPAVIRPARRLYYTLYFLHAVHGRQEVHEARTALRARTWWKLDDCLAALTVKGIAPAEIRLHPHSVPAGLPAPLQEAMPTVSARRRGEGGLTKAAPATGEGQAGRAGHQLFAAWAATGCSGLMIA